jgi:hypothetical protein
MAGGNRNFHKTQKINTIHSLMCIVIVMYYSMSKYMPIAVAALSKASVCGRSLAGIAGSNNAGGKDVCFL